MKLRFASAVVVFIVGLLFFGCSKSKSPQARLDNAPRNDQEAIKAAINDHLNSDNGVNMSSMEMKVDSVNVNGDVAQADAEFRAKNGPGAMHITYKLERRGNQWIVLTGEPSAMAPSQGGGGDSQVGQAPGSPKSTPDVSDYMKKH